ncbi:hypothetical protein ABW21_db0202560 [Orbilia brochopaga]|nr:hypothetical protein ABW21_db0202560 [Drechslerella brochopaga]
MPWRGSKLRRLLSLKRSSSNPPEPSSEPGPPVPTVIPPEIHLPVEIWLDILYYVGTSPQSQYTYASLASVCRRLNIIVTPFLYESLILPLWQLAKDRELQTGLIAKACVARQFGLFCPEQIPWKLYIEGEKRPGVKYFDPFGLTPQYGGKRFPRYPPQLTVDKILNAIPAGQLETFVWSCNIPLGSVLYDNIRYRQPNITTLWLKVQDLTLPGLNSSIPDSSNFSKDVFSLASFTNLQHLSLHGNIEPSAGFSDGGFSQRGSVSDILSTIDPIFKNLKTLSLGAHHEGFKYQHRGDNGPADTPIPRASAESLHISYPNLETFAFDPVCGTSQTLQRLKLERISQLPNLTSLYAPNRTENMRFLKYWSPDIPIRLTTLHVDCCRNDVLIDFLFAFQGLVDLDIVMSPWEESFNARPIIHHKETLRRLSIRSIEKMVAGHGCSMYGTEPISAELMRTLGDYLDNLEELCVTLCGTGDPFDKFRFKNLRLLWVYNHQTPKKCEPDFWWFPCGDESTNKSRFRMPSVPDPQGSVLKCLPKNLKIVVAGNYPRQNRHPNGVPRVYELIGRDFFITWKRVDLRQLATKQMRFDVDPDEDDGSFDPVKKDERQNLISFANQTSKPHTHSAYTLD